MHVNMDKNRFGSKTSILNKGILPVFGIVLILFFGLIISVYAYGLFSGNAVLLSYKIPRITGLQNGMVSGAMQISMGGIGFGAGGKEGAPRHVVIRSTSNSGFDQPEPEIAPMDSLITEAKECISEDPEITVVQPYDIIADSPDNLSDGIVYVFVRNMDDVSCAPKNFVITVFGELLPTSYSNNAIIAPNELRRFTVPLHTSTEAGAHEITIYVDVDFAHYTEYFNVLITPSIPNRIEVSPEYVEMEINSTQLFQAQLYDEFDNEISDVNVTDDIDWEVLWDFEEGVDYDLDADGANLLFTPYTVDNFVINASYEVNETASITDNAVAFVGYPECEHRLPDIDVSPGSVVVAAGGYYETNLTLTNIDDAWCAGVTYSVTVYVPEDGDSDPTTMGIALLPGENETVAFTVTAPTNAGEYNVTYNMVILGEDLSENITQSLSVTAGLPAELVVSKMPDIGTLPAGSSIEYYVSVYDEEGNEITDYTVDWSVSGINNEIVESNVSYANILFRTVGNSSVVINVTKDDASLNFQDIIAVTPGSADHIIITPSYIDLEIGQAIDFNATVYDEYNNEISIDSVDWSLSPIGSGGHIDDNGLFYSDLPGQFNVTASVYIVSFSTNDYSERLYGFETVSDEVLQASFTEITGTAIANVTVPDIATIDVIPEEISIGITQTADIEAHVYNTDDEEVIMDLVWDVLPDTLGDVTVINETNVVFTPLMGGDGEITVTEPLSGVNTTVPVHIDAVGPVIMFVDPTPTDAGSSRQSVTVNVTVDENVSEVLLEIDWLANLSMIDMGDNIYTLTRDFTVGEHSIRVFATDLYDNTAYIGPRTFTVYDNLAPTITLLSPENGSDIYYEDTIVLNITDDSGIDSSRYRWDVSTWESFVTDYNITVPNTLSQGEHNLTIEATDDDSEVITRIYLFNFNDYPVITLNSPDNGTNVDDSTVIDFNVTDDDTVYVTYQIGSSPLFVFAPPYDISVAEVSEYMSGMTEVIVEASDVDGFITTESFWFNYTVPTDNPPVIELVPPTENDTYIDPGYVIQVNITDDYGFAPSGYATYQWDSDTPQYVSGVSLDSNSIVDIDTTGMLSGTHELTVYALDNSGLFATEVYTFTVSSAPVITLLNPSDGDNITVGDVIVLNITDDGSLTTTEWAWDDPGAYTPFTVEYNITVPSLGSGDHVLYIHAVDDTLLETEVNYTFTYLENPHVILNSPANGSHVDDGAIIDLDVTDDGSVEFAGYKWNDGPEFVLEDPWDIIVDYDLMVADENNLTVRARDNDGLWTTVSYVFYGNNTLPTVLFDPANGSVTTDAGQVITVNMNDPTGLSNITYTCPGDSANTIDLEGNLTAEITFTCGWTSGMNVVPVSVMDIDGGHTDYNYVLIYDADGPVITLISPSEGSDIAEGDTIVLDIIDLETEVDVAQYKWDDGVLQDFTVEWNITVPSLEAGSHNLTIEANDSEGHASTRMFTFNVPPFEGNIDGYVYDIFGMPVSGANVTVDGTSWNATTDSSGYFLIENITEGIYNVTASALSYESQTIIGVGVSGNETTHINYYLIQYGSINGTVTDWFSAPIGGADITIYEAGTMNIVATGTTDITDGTYQIDDILPGWYDVEASAVGYVTTTVTWQLISAGEVTTVNIVMDS